ncbi:MAG: PLP-dependent aminotransferase family protein [Maribacter sp.]|nr:PLP-dependent aminotransferase family protein [Maribacter sp.]
MYYNVKNILFNYGFGPKQEYSNIYMNLYNALVKAIVNRDLVENGKLPPSRVLAKDLKISRSTVIKAYDILILEKYIYSVPGSGCFVASPKDKKIRINLNAQTEQGNYPRISKRGVSFIRNIQPIKTGNMGIAFRPGLPPLDIFPVQQWQQLSNDYWKTIRSSELSYSNTFGLECLRENISNYLKIYRNINCDAEQIIITTGSLHSLFLIGNALINKKDGVVIENPTYPHAYSLFNSLRAKIFSTHIDEEGISVASIKCQNPKLVYTTPSNQYPSGIKMSMKRRMELLKWANKENTFIVEDDYDHEFSNWEKPLTSIYGLDGQERVIYLGTFNKLLHPSIRMGYMIVPYYLLDAIRALYEQSSRFVPPSMQKTLSTFIERDYLNKHLRKVIETSILRKQMFVQHFEDKFANRFILESNPLGLHIIAKDRQPFSDILTSSILAKKGITAHPFSNYFIGNSLSSGLVMGYASVNEKIIKKKLEMMHRVLDAAPR